MKKFARFAGAIMAGLAFLWLILTVWVEADGPARIRHIGVGHSAYTALIVYDPDPIYNLDEQVCTAFGEALANRGWRVTIATPAAIGPARTHHFTLYVLCANTYNWSPDETMQHFVNSLALTNKPVVAITLGAGTTSRSKKLFETQLISQGAQLLGSKTFWLMRPNAATKTGESNVQAATSLVARWAREVSDGLMKAQRARSTTPQIKG